VSPRPFPFEFDVYPLEFVVCPFPFGFDLWWCHLRPVSPAATGTPGSAGYAELVVAVGGKSHLSGRYGKPSSGERSRDPSPAKNSVPPPLDLGQAGGSNGGSADSSLLTPCHGGDDAYGREEMVSPFRSTSFGLGDNEELRVGSVRRSNPLANETRPVTHPHQSRQLVLRSDYQSLYIPTAIPSFSRSLV
jgi:hypothetical protein